MKRNIEARYQELIQSFLRLMQNKKFHEISIEEISLEAKMSRVNFYNYFTDKEDILWKTFLYSFLELEKKVEKIDPLTWLSEGKPLTFYVFESIKNNKLFFHNLFVNGMPFSFIDNLLDYICKESFRTHDAFRKIYQDEKIPYIRINQYLSGALFNLIRSLLKENEDWDSLEVSNFFTEISVSGFNSFISKRKSNKYIQS